MLGTDLVSMLLRIGELAFSAVVAGLTGQYLHSVHGSSSWSKKRFIYTEVVAGLSILMALLWLLPFSGGFIHWPVDLLLFAAWMVAFGLLVNFIGPLHCGSVFYWGNITNGGTCEKWKADVAFTFLSAMFWLVSAALGLYWMRKHRRTTTKSNNASQRRWYRSHRV